MLQKYREAFQRLSHSFFKPTLLAIVSFIILVVLLFSTFFFRSVYLSLEQDVYDMAKSQADLSARNVSILLTDVSNLSAKIVNDKKLSKKAYDRGHRDAYLALMEYTIFGSSFSYCFCVKSQLSMTTSFTARETAWKICS